MRLHLLALALVATIAGTPAIAGDKGHDGKHGGHGKGGSRAFCPHCGDACYPTVTKGTETKHCWNVETKAICIPKVRFPWDPCVKGKGGKDSCPPPKCGRTKHVRVLMKHEYECSTCEYSWDVDSYKNGNGHGKYDDKSDKAPAGVPTEAAPADAAPSVPVPPSVEASSPLIIRRVAPVTFDQSSTTAPAKKSYAEILTTFFR